MALPSIQTLKQLPQSDQKYILDQLFEPCDTLSNFIFIKVFPQQFTTYLEFINLVRKELINLLKENELNPIINEIISTHPRLGEPKRTTFNSFIK